MDYAFRLRKLGNVFAVKLKHLIVNVYTWALVVFVIAGVVNAIKWFSLLVASSTSRLEPYAGPGRLWWFRIDMNCDGTFTISDCIAGCSWLFHFPGDLGVWLFTKHPEISHFLELNLDYYGGKLSFLIGILFCMCLWEGYGEVLAWEGADVRDTEEEECA